MAALAVSMLALAACGGGDDTSATTDTTQGTPLTESDFASQGNAICAAGNEDIQAGAADLGQKPSQADIESFATDTLVPSIQDQINQLSALGAPEGETEQVDAFLTDAQDTLDQLKDDPSLAAQNDLFADVNKQATALGLTECAG